jgi:sensor histidine kinase YesM
LRISVIDNGNGANNAPLEMIRNEIQNQSHESRLTGLPGVNRRLKYYYPSAPDIQIKSLKKGLQVDILIPLVV